MKTVLRRLRIIMSCVVCLTPVSVLAQQGDGVKDAKEISGMSLVGNKDAPKSLYIVPWKTSEIGVKTDLTSSLLNEDLMPVDKPVFIRQLDFYQVSTGTLN